MTPDAVIYRYLQIVAPADCDREKLCLLLASDADLLTRWLKLLDVEANIAALQDRIECLDNEELAGLAQAQAWSVLPIVGSARLSADQWLAVLRAAYLAEILANYMSRERSEFIAEPLDNVRLRALLAISGVHLANDPKLEQLIEFRGTNPALLEDAACELRIFAVIDAMEVGREVELAQQLLGLEADTFAALIDEAEAAADQLVAQIGVDTQGDVDWAHRIWLRQQISIVAACFRACGSWQEFLPLHKLVSRSLFAQPPLILLQEADAGPLRHLGSQEVAIGVESRTSLVAAAARSGRPTPVNESTGLAVVDRQMLRLLHTQDAIAVPLPNQARAVVMLVATDEDIDVDVAAELYAEEIARRVTSFADPAVGTAAQDNSLLEQFRASEYRRLREIVHEANNPLSIVHNYLHILELRLQHEPEAVEQLELIATELRRAGSLFTRARDIPEQIEVEVAIPGEVTEVDAGNWAARLAELHSGYAAERGIPLHTRLPAQSVLLLTQVDKLTQVISNLVKNAIEACEPSDEVLLGVRGGIYRDGRVGAEIFVEDSGPGLTDDVLQNLNQAKQSAKGGDHQGLGLQVAFKLALELDGALDVRTETGLGTTFSLFLPLTVPADALQF